MVVVLYIYIYTYLYIYNGNHSLPLILGLTLIAKQFEYYYTLRFNEVDEGGILDSLCPFVRPSFHMSVKSTIMTENKPIIGRMQALSSTDGDIFWWHTPYLSFWLWLEKYLVTMDPYCGTLIPSNLIPLSLPHFACGNIDINYSILDCENISHATYWTDEFETVNKP